MSCIKTSCTALAIIVAGANFATAQQAISTSLTECSVIYQNLAEIGERRGKPEAEVSLAEVNAAIFMDKARDAAKREGHSNPVSHIKAEHLRLGEKWSGRLSKLQFLEQNKDWIDYCRALGKDLGMDMQ